MRASQGVMRLLQPLPGMPSNSPRQGRTCSVRRHISTLVNWAMLALHARACRE